MLGRTARVVVAGGCALLLPRLAGRGWSNGDGSLLAAASSSPGAGDDGGGSGHRARHRRSRRAGDELPGRGAAHPDAQRAREDLRPQRGRGRGGRREGARRLPAPAHGQRQDTQHAYAGQPNNIATANLTVTQPVINASAFPLYGQAKDARSTRSTRRTSTTSACSPSTPRARSSRVLNAQDVVQAAQRQLENAKANLADTQARAEAQLTSSNDVTRAAGRHGRARRARSRPTRAPSTTRSCSSPSRSTRRSRRRSSPPEATLAAAQRARRCARRRSSASRWIAGPTCSVAKYQAAAAHDFADEPLLRLVPTLGAPGPGAPRRPTPPRPARWNDEIVAGDAHLDPSTTTACATPTSTRATRRPTIADLEPASARAQRRRAGAQRGRAARRGAGGVRVARGRGEGRAPERRRDGDPLPAGARQGDRARRRERLALHRRGQLRDAPSSRWRRRTSPAPGAGARARSGRSSK